MNTTINKINLTKDFFFGGNSTFTIKSERTGEWKTFKITRSKPNERFPTPSYFVALLTGPNNELDYTYIGKINPRTGEITFTKGSKRNDMSPDVVTLRWFMKHLFTDGMLQNATVRHEGRCGCCGRKLTTPLSCDRGIGPECWERMGM
jgi:hypothetical protein